MTPLQYLDDFAIRQFIQLALMEDVGEGDHTTQAVIPESTQAHARLRMKTSGYIAGINLAERIFLHIDPNLTVKLNTMDGKAVKNGEILMEIEGAAHSMLKAERLVLNCMQRMSGIATYTRNLVEKIKDTGTQLLDTRKTTPNFRMMEKWAVVIGGGKNHRMGLYDMILVKDNHIDVAGGVEPAVKNIEAYLEKNNLSLPVEIEARSIDEVSEILQFKQVNRILLDNMDLHTLQRAVDIIGGKKETEASGNISEENIRDIAECGVDYISMGALTYGYNSLDISMQMET